MKNPYLIIGPAVVSLSGGRTSGYMVRRILDAGLQPDVYIVVADTGREFAETWQFLRDMAAHWGVRIYRVKRKGQFGGLIYEKRYLPNVMARFCTQKLKVEPINEFMIQRGHAEFTTVIGIRADEPRRVAKIRRRIDEDGEDIVLPLVKSGVTREDVMSFWAQQPFDLALEWWESNCDLCFLKGQRIRERIILDHPETAEDWIDNEVSLGARFDKAVRVSELEYLAHHQLYPEYTPVEADNHAMDCLCHD